VFYVGFSKLLPSKTAFEIGRLDIVGKINLDQTVKIYDDNLDCKE
jgi:hypothetical protein